MKKGILVLVATMWSGLIMAQNAGVSKPISVNIVKEIIPAILDIVPGSVEFVDKSGNNAIDANETCYIRFQVRNTGKGDGIGCKVKISATGTANGVRYADKTLPTIAAGSTQTVEIPLTAGMGTLDGVANFRFEVTEPQGFGTDPGELSVATKAFVSPMLQIVDYSITSSTGSSQLQKKSPFDLQLMLQNTQYGKAENVKVQISLPEGVYLMDGEELMSFASIDGGSAKSLVYSLIVTNNYANTNIPVKVELKEKWGKYAENKTINLQLNQTMASNKLVVDEVRQQRDEIQIAQIGSAVDKNIPHTDVVNKNTFALIIANEDYMSVDAVPFAKNDGNIFKKYCINTLGIPERNIHLRENATLNIMRSDLGWLKQVCDAYKGEASIIFYYAGHGIPDENDKSAYLLPTDGDGRFVQSGYKLDDLYSRLGSMLAKSVTVFMDACFSGSQRGPGMLASARGVALKAKSGVPQGKMVVFSAAQGDETAYPNNEEGHGMFTYYLLKKLQETKGDVTLKELGDYITTNVSQQSIVLNSKSQTPCVTPASAVADSWKNWKLK
ncbi:MAG: caspase family protein [Paludibacteraceae bacterium]|nr:caspase family protein [Paludibacteraceae bacterium]